MSEPVRILIVEDKEVDYELAQREIRKALNSCVIQQVETRQEFLTALETFQPDLVLSDYSLPRFNGLEALKLLRERMPLIPLILWTGSLSEDIAVESMKAGANNYVIKENIQRLGPAVIHALEERRLTLERQRAEEQLEANEKRFRALIENSSDSIALLDTNGTITYASPAVSRILGYSVDEYVGQNAFDFIHPNDLQNTGDLFSQVLAQPGVGVSGQLRERHKDGSWRWLEGIATNLLDEPSVRAIVANFRDITERRQSEERIQRQIEYLTALRNIDIAIGSSFDLNVTFGVVLQQVVSQLNVDAAAILLFNPHAQRLEYVSSLGFRSDVIRSTHLKLGEGYASRAIRERHTIHSPYLLSGNGETAKLPHLAMEDFVDYYGIPLIVKGEAKGVLEVYHRSLLNPGLEWLDFLATLSGQAALAIDNAQLFEGLQRANAELEQRVANRTTELNRTNIELEHANRAKDEFLATMSHELRTPLNSILGLSESLLEERRGSLNEHQKNSLQIVETSGRHLLDLINDVLDLSKIEAGKLDYYPQIIEVDAVCRSTLAFVKEQALRKSIELKYAEDRTVSKIYADPRRLKQILINLLTNAIKFTLAHGQVTLQVHSDVERDLIQFSVIDNGIGIANEDLKKLFQPFVQVDSSFTREFEGTGLGLALVQSLTDLHGGSVQVESEVGKGSRFTVSIPWGNAIVSSHEAGKSAAEISASEQAQKTRVRTSAPQNRILLAEDNLANILTIGEYLESYGYEIVTAHDGTEAITKAEETDPGLILMDIQMPSVDGLEAIRRLRKNPRFDSTPIIALTALVMPGDYERCIEAGADEYMSKPVSLKLLTKTMSRLLGKANNK